MAVRKKKAAQAQESTTSSFDSKEIAKGAFIEHSHASTVYVKKSNGDFYLHAPNEKRAGEFDVVERSEVDLETETPAE